MRKDNEPESYIRSLDGEMMMRVGPSQYFNAKYYLRLLKKAVKEKKEKEEK